MAEHIISSGESNGIISENDTMTIINGGEQAVLDLQTSPRQIIYLDFDGELTKYRNADLDMVIDDVQVEDSKLTRERIAGIVALLNADFSTKNVLFVTERPKNTAYSTIFVGKTSAFDQYGQFAGLAETVDLGNRTKDDNAFVLLDSTDSDSGIISTIAHEAGHLLGTLDHGGDGLDRYAAYTYYYIKNNCAFTGTLYDNSWFSEALFFSLVHYSNDREYISSSWNNTNKNSYCQAESGGSPWCRYDKVVNIQVRSKENLFVDSGCFASKSIVNGGSMYISRGGSSDEITINSGGFVEVRGVAINTTIDSAGKLTVLGGGLASNTTVNPDGLLNIHSGVVSNTTVNPNARLGISAGGSANGTIVHKLAQLNILSGGTATAVQENGGYVYVSSGAYVTFVSHSISDLVLSHYQSASLHSATSAFNASIIDHSKIDVFGGMTISATVSKTAYLYVCDGGIAGNTRLDGGYMIVSDGGMANETFNIGSMYIRNNGTANETLNRGSMFVSSGGTANSTTVSTGYFHISSGGTANETTLNSGGLFYISSGGSANTTMVDSGGRLEVGKGGTATMIKENGGWVSVNTGAFAGFVSNSLTGLTLSNASASVHSITVANNTTISARGHMAVMGGTANVTTVESGGSFHISSGGTANSTTVNSGGFFHISSGGTANVTTVESGGSFHISGSGKATGLMTFSDGAVVSADPGSIIDFDISELEPGSEARLNNLSIVSGRNNAQYTITVSGGQAYGEYVLAEGASDFNKTISIVNTSGKDLDVLTVGRTIRIGDTYYALKQHDDVLSVRIGDLETVEINYRFSDIGQTVYYDGPAPEESTFTGTLMMIPFTADITVTLNKSLSEGEYEFTTSVAEVPGSVNPCWIRIADAEGLPGLNGEEDKWSVAYISNDACHYGTKVGETSSTVTYRFTDVSDYLLIDSIPDDTLDLGVACGTLNDGSLVVSPDKAKVTYSKEKNYDTNKKAAIEQMSGKGSLVTGEEYSFVIDRIVAYHDKKGNTYYKVEKNSNRYKYEATYTIGTKAYHSLTVTESNSSIVFALKPEKRTDADVVITVDSETLNAKIMVGNDTSQTPVSGDIKKHAFAPWDYGHCWVATASNMLAAAGYLSVSAEECFDILNKRYFIEDGKKSIGSRPERVFKDFLTNTNVRAASMIFQGNSIGRGLSNIESGKGKIVGAICFETATGSHVITCYNVSLNKAKTQGTVTYADSDDIFGNMNSSTEGLPVATVYQINGDWYIDLKYYGKIYHIVSIYSLIANNSGNKIGKSELLNYKLVADSDSIYSLVFRGILSSEDGTVTVSEFISDSIVMSDGNLTIAAGAEAKEMVVHEGGSVNFNSGSIAKGTIRTAGGSLTVESGVDVSGAEFDFAVSYLDGGNDVPLLNCMSNVSGSKLSITVVNGQSAGKYVLAGGAAGFNRTLSVVGEYDCLQSFGKGFENGLIGELGLDNTLCIEGQTYSLVLEEDNLVLVISSGSVSSGTVVDGDTMNVFTGETIADTHIDSGGKMVVCNGGTANDIILDSGGGLYIFSSGTITGQMVFSSGAIVSAFDGAALDFDLTRTDAGTSAILNDLSVVKGTPVYTLTVDETLLENRIYTLAENAAGFNATIAIQDISGTQFGTLSVGQKTSIHEVDYLLNLANGVLTLSVSSWRYDKVPPTVSVSADITALTEQNVTVTAVFRDDIKLASSFYRLGESGEWKKYTKGITVSKNITIYFKAVDKAGNESEIVSYQVRNICQSDVVVSSGATVIVSSGQLYVDTIVNSGGKVFVSSGGTASTTTVNSGGSICVSSGGTVNNTNASHGCIDVSSGGTANNLTLVSGALFVSGNGMVNNTVASGANLYLHSGGTMNDTTVNAGNLHVSSGGTANNIIVSAGSLYVSSGGTANNISIKNSGYLYVSGGGTASIAFNPFIQGKIVSGGGAIVTYLKPDMNVYFGNGQAGFVSSANTMTRLVVDPGFSAFIYEDGRIDSLTVNSGGRVYVSSGGTANNAVVNASGALVVSSGGTADNTTINNRGFLYVSNGGIANSTTVKSGGSLNVLNGGMASSTMIGSGGSAYISSGGTADNAVVNSSGALIISSGGTADNVAVKSGGTLVVFGGGTATNIDWTPCEGHIRVLGDVLATFASQYSGIYYGSDNQLLSNAPTMDSMLLGKSCEMNIMSSGFANDVTIESGGRLNVYNGGIANGTTVNSGGWFYVSSGGIANSTTVNSSGQFNVYNGGIANGTTVNSSGRLYVSSGGTASGTTLYSNGSLAVSGGGTANKTTVHSGGWLYVSSGGTAIEIMEDGGYVFVASEANAAFASNSFSGLILSSTSATIHSGTTANDITVRSGGSLYVCSGGTATNIDWTPCEGLVSISDGGHATFTSQLSGVYYGSNNQLLSHATEMESITVTGNKASMYVMSGGTANSAVLSGGRMWVSDGGTVSNTTLRTGQIFVSSGGVTADTTAALGSLFVFSGGTVDNTTLNTSAILHVYNGGVANTAVINTSGRIDVFSGGTVNSTAVNSAGSLYVSGGGTATNATVNGGRMNVVSGGTATGITVNGSSLWIGLGGMAAGITVNAKGKVEIASGGTAIEILENGGHVSVASDAVVSFASNLLSGLVLTNSASIHSGTTAISATVGLGGRLDVFSGGTATEIAESGGYVDILSGAEVTIASNAFSGLVLSYNTSASIHSGTTAISTIINGNLHIFSGGIANDAAVNSGGYLHISSGGIATDATVNSGGRIYVSGGGTAIGASVTSSGRLDVFSGGTVDSVMINDSRGELHVYSGGIANSTTISLGDIFITVGGIAESTIVNHGGWGFVSFSGTANNTLVNSDGRLYISSGGIANDTIISRGTLEITCDGIANNTILSDGRLYISSGGIANNTILSRGLIYISSGGKLTGKMTFGKGALVSAYSGAILDFDLTRTSAGAAAQINDLSQLSGRGNAVYTLTVDGMQASGNYALADRAAGFVNAITVVNTAGDELGMLTVGKTVNIAGTEYTLNLNNGTLSLSVERIILPDTVAPRVSNVKADITAPTQRDVTVTADFDDDEELAKSFYSIGDQMNWKTYVNGVTVSENTTVYFKAVDSAGNESEVVSYEVTNIDTVAPVITLTGNNQTPLQQVTLTATVDDGSPISYRIGDSGEWTAYTEAITVTANATYFFKATDAAGNEDAKQITFANIDTEKPTVSITPNTFDPAQSVTVTAEFSDNVALRSKQYRIGNGEWTDYTNGITVADNTIVYFKVIDTAGNESAEASIEIKNIDTTKPVITLSADTKTPLKKTTLTATVDDGSPIYYRIGETGEWTEYKEAFTVTTNATYYFKATDAAGNEGTNSLTFANIDTVAPVINLTGDNQMPLKSATLTATVDDGSPIIYSTDEVTWLDYTETIEVTANATYYFKATDAAGNVGTAKYVFANIDKVPPVLTLSGDNETMLQASTLTATVADDSEIFYSLDNVTWAKYESVITVDANATYYFKAVDAAGNSSTAEYAFANILPKTEVVKQTQTWEAAGQSGEVGEETQYIVEYSTDNFEHVIQMVVDSNSLDSFQMPAGTYQWRVKAEDADDWSVGQTFVAAAESDTPKVVQSNADGNDDLFFATANGAWENIYYAQNVGSINDWTGTNEIISANGKGRIQNLFFGSSDPNVLCLTDGENGDAIFVDDVYTELPESVAEHTARLYKIQEVRAGAGDDIVDMTSQRFEYVGDGLTIRGGDGNDTIWATKGDNWLFGDAGNDRIVGASGNDVIIGGIGNDRMHGGGGGDIFTFCDNWGEDMVEQLAGGSVTLWFASGDESKWDAEKLTYTDGDNSVTVKCIASVTLKFGDDGSDKYDELAAAGAFAEFTSQKIFEESKGILA